MTGAALGKEEAEKENPSLVIGEGDPLAGGEAGERKGYPGFCIGGAASPHRGVDLLRCFPQLASLR